MINILEYCIKNKCAVSLDYNDEKKLFCLAVVKRTSDKIFWRERSYFDAGDEQKQNFHRHLNMNILICNSEIKRKEQEENEKI